MDPGVQASSSQQNLPGLEPKPFSEQTGIFDFIDNLDHVSPDIRHAWKSRGELGKIFDQFIRDMGKGTSPEDGELLNKLEAHAVTRLAQSLGSEAQRQFEDEQAQLDEAKHRQQQMEGGLQTLAQRTEIEQQEIENVQRQQDEGAKASMARDELLAQECANLRQELRETQLRLLNSEKEVCDSLQTRLDQFRNLGPEGTKGAENAAPPNPNPFLQRTAPFQFPLKQAVPFQFPVPAPSEPFVPPPPVQEPLFKSRTDQEEPFTPPTV